jgi:hypothetical protein
VSANELDAMQILNILVNGTPVIIDEKGQFGHTIKKLNKGDVIILEQLLSSNVKVARLSNIHSSHLGKDHTLGRSAAYILQWHRTGSYPLNLPIEFNKTLNQTP